MLTVFGCFFFDFMAYIFFLDDKAGKGDDIGLIHIYISDDMPLFVFFCCDVKIRNEKIGTPSGMTIAFRLDGLTSPESIQLRRG